MSQTDERLIAVEKELDVLRTMELPFTVGTAFPSSPNTNTLFYRTDLGWLCYYDGTRWLTVHEYSIVANPNRTTVSVNTIWDTRVRTDYAMYLTYVAISTNAAATNNGTNFWTMTFQGVNLALSAATTFYQPNTSADTAGVETDHSGAVVSNNAPSNNHYIRLSVSKTLTPGNLTIAATVYYRLIVT